MSDRRAVIKLTFAEIMSGTDRQRFAEVLIRELPLDHDGRSTWLLNYGEGTEAQHLREIAGVDWDADTRSARPVLGTPSRMPVNDGQAD